MYIYSYSVEKTLCHEWVHEAVIQQQNVGMIQEISIALLFHHSIDQFDDYCMLQAVKNDGDGWENRTVYFSF